jgi:hypothetical protein
MNERHGSGGRSRRLRVKWGLKMADYKPILIGLGVGMATICAIGWTMLNMPQATGSMLTGKVIYCREQGLGHPSSWCMVQLDMDSRTVPVDMAREFPGQQLSLLEMRKRFTGQTQYLVRDRGQH